MKLYIFLNDKNAQNIALIIIIISLCCNIVTWPHFLKKNFTKAYLLADRKQKLKTCLKFL